MFWVKAIKSIVHVHLVSALVSLDNQVYSGCGFEVVQGQPDMFKFCNAYGHCIKTSCGIDRVFSKSDCGCVPSMMTSNTDKTSTIDPDQISSPENSTIMDERTRAVASVVIGFMDAEADPLVNTLGAGESGTGTTSTFSTGSSPLTDTTSTDVFVLLTDLTNATIEQENSDQNWTTAPTETFSDHNWTTATSETFSDQNWTTAPSETFSDHNWTTAPSETFSDQNWTTAPSETFSDQNWTTAQSETFSDQNWTSAPSETFSDQNSISSPSETFSDQNSITISSLTFSDQNWRSASPAIFSNQNSTISSLTFSETYFSTSSSTSESQNFTNFPSTTISSLTFVDQNMTSSNNMQQNKTFDVNGSYVCQAEVKITGMNDNEILTGESSVGRVYIGVRGLSNNNGTIHFNGNSVLWIPFYDSIVFSSGLSISMEIQENATYQARQGIANNCGNNVTPSFSIILNPILKHIIFKVVVISISTTSPNVDTLEISVPYKPGEKKVVEMDCDGNSLIGRVGDNLVWSPVLIKDKYMLSSRPKPIYVGKGCSSENTADYYGEISKIIIHRCTRSTSF